MVVEQVAMGDKHFVLKRRNVTCPVETFNSKDFDGRHAQKSIFIKFNLAPDLTLLYVNLIHNHINNEQQLYLI